jgi:hypothetical protein
MEGKIRKAFIAVMAVLVAVFVYSIAFRQKDNVGPSGWFNPKFKLGVRTPPATREALVAESKSGWYCEGDRAGLLDANGAVVKEYAVDQCGRLEIFGTDILHKLMSRSNTGANCLIGILGDGQYALKCDYRVIPPKPGSRDQVLRARTMITLLDGKGEEVWKTGNYVPGFGVWTCPDAGKLVYLSSSISPENGPCLHARSGYSDGCTETIILQDLETASQSAIGPFSYVYDEEEGKHSVFSPSMGYLLSPVLRSGSGPKSRIEELLVLVDIKTGESYEYPRDESWSSWEVTNAGLVVVLEAGKWRYINQQDE